MGDILVFVVVVGAIVGGGTLAFNSWVRKRIIAQAPPGAQIDPDDDLQTALAKSRNHHRVIEAVRIFNEIKHSDDIVPVLDRGIRNDIDKFLVDYYKSN